MTQFSDVVELIRTTKDKELLEDFLIGLTTPYERHVLTRRVEIVKRLLKGEQQQTIASDLNVGVSTVTRGSRELSRGRFQVLRKKK